MVILFLECKKWIDCCFNFLNWRRYFLFNFLEWLLRLYHWRFIHSHVLSTSDPALEHNHRVRKTSRCIPFLNVLVLNEPFYLVEA